MHNAGSDVVDVDGDPPTWPGKRAGRKDTVFVPPRSRCAFSVGFGQHPGGTSPYMFHCHLLAHEDAGMMGQFVLVEPGHTPGRAHAHP
ncbi:multicopper oxidase domain-containing protein [Pseudonocardia sp. MCCB 268]|nr:multicopper oxidase domain-containing protein [Pseudonocardia cytotoxica]